MLDKGPSTRHFSGVEGSPSFRVLNERALKRAARSFLEQRYHPSDVAEELGFSDLRSFARAFRRWIGVTPAAYAKQLALRDSTEGARVTRRVQSHQSHARWRARR